MTRPRLRDIGIRLGCFEPGRYNAITDVPGVLVGHSTIIRNEPDIVRTGVTVISPRNGEIWNSHAFAAVHAFNGFGEIGGAAWIEESGLLCSPIVLTGTTAVGTVHRAMQKFTLDNRLPFTGFFPVVLETADTWLNPPEMSPLTSLDVYRAMSSAGSGPVAEGSVGGGTGMTCHELKGGIGTSSRVVVAAGGTYVLGALVQSNHGRRSQLRIDGVPVGREIDAAAVPTPVFGEPGKGSIIIVLATDAPFLPVQLKRLARRAVLGLARTGGIGESWSGDIFLAFATGNEVAAYADREIELKMLPHAALNSFFEAAGDAVEEAILNSLLAAETMEGYEGRTAYALPLETVQHIMAGRSSG